MRVVLDANVLVSALVLPGGRGDAALRRVVAGRDEWLLSKAILDELLEVLGRRFARDSEELAHVAVFFTDLSTVVRPRRRLHVVEDDPDNRILECAVTGRAQTVVTGDKALLALDSFQGIRMMTLASYLEQS